MEPDEPVSSRRFIDPNELPTPPVNENDPSAFGKRQKIKVKLADGKERTIQHMIATTFWHPDGTPMTVQQFMEMLFGTLPELFRDEDELRQLWAAPDTRATLLQALAERGFGSEQMAEMQTIIDADKSDLLDVLAHIAYALPPLTREERAAKTKVVISTHFNSKQRVFLDFDLSHYVWEGVRELDQEKFTPLLGGYFAPNLGLKYQDSIADAVADLGKPEEIGKASRAFRSSCIKTKPPPRIVDGRNCRELFTKLFGNLNALPDSIKAGK